MGIGTKCITQFDLHVRAKTMQVEIQFEKWFVFNQLLALQPVGLVSNTDK